MDEVTRPCTSCGKPLPEDASFCSTCGVAQAADADSAPESSAFELTEPLTLEPADEEPPSSPASQASPGEVQAPLRERVATDSDLIEIEFDTEDDEDTPSEDRVSEGLVREEGVREEGVRDDTDSPDAPGPTSSAPKAQAEAPETSQTVRMKMSDVIHAWNEDAGVDEDTPAQGDASTDGLPKGFIVALVAILAIMATLLYFVT